MGKLKMFTNDFDYIIAESREEAKAIAMETVGYSAEDVKADDFTTVDRRKTFTFFTDWPGRKEGITKTFAAWIKEKGKGYFACTEC